MKTRLLNKCGLLLAVVLLAGCANFDARLKTAYDVHTATTQSVASALDAQVITSTDAEAFQDIALNSRLVLDSARALKDSDIDSAEGKLKLANDILLEIHTYLLKKEKGR